MLLPCSTDIATTTAVLLPPPQCWPCPPPCYHQAAPTATATPLLPPPPPPPALPTCHCLHQAAAVAVISLQDKFDNEKELYNNADIDCIQLSQLFRLGVKFLHGGMRPIFDTLVYLSLYCNNL
jgi:hypothetical protein